MTPHVTLKGGPPVHPLIYSKRIHDADRSIQDGDIVEVRTKEGRPAGFAFANRRSMVALRMLSFDPDIYPDEKWMRAKLREAESIRRDILRYPEQGNAWRVAHAEADGLCGLVIDRYRDIAVAGLYSLGWFQRLKTLETALIEELGFRELVSRTDKRTEEQEGFSAPRPPRIPPKKIVENGLRFEVDITGGHKTGFFLDQREGRQRVGVLAKGRRVFDGMTYTGGLAMAAARGGAHTVLGVDLDEKAVALARENASKNDLNVRFAHGDVFDHLRELKEKGEAERPDLLIVDPSKWARDRAGIGSALARYRDLNRLAFEAVASDGLVLTHSCSGLISEDMFLSLIRDLSMDLRRHVRVLEVRGAPADHPIAAHVPEGRYLKAVLLAVGAKGSGPGRYESFGRDESGEEVPESARPRRERPQREFAAQQDRGPRRDYGNRDDRGPRRDYGNRDDRGPRRDYGKRDDRGPRRDYGNRDDRGPRRDYGNRDDRGPRRDYGNRDDRGPRRDYGNRDDRGPRRDFGNRDDRGPRRDHGNRDDRGPRRDYGNRDDRGPRRDHGNRGDRGPRRDFGNRDARGPQRDPGNRGDRGPRRDTGNRDDRGPRGGQGKRDDRGPRQDRGAGRAPDKR